MTNDGNYDQGPFGDVIPQPGSSQPEINPSLDQEDVEDRDNVSIVSPEDYPEDERSGEGLSGGQQSYGGGSDDMDDEDEDMLDEEEDEDMLEDDEDMDSPSGTPDYSEDANR